MDIKFQIVKVLFGWCLFSCLFQLTRSEWKAIESPCLCQEFRCSSNAVCLHAQRVCDGNKDCPDAEDETNNFMVNGKCRRQKKKCSDGEFPCKFGDCIQLTKVCDGVIDCWGAVDEASDFCNWVHDPNSTLEDAPQG